MTDRVFLELLVHVGKCVVNDAVVGLVGPAQSKTTQDTAVAVAVVGAGASASVVAAAVTISAAAAAAAAANNGGH